MKCHTTVLLGLCNRGFRCPRTGIWRLQFHGWWKFYRCLQEVVRISICSLYTTRSPGSSSPLLYCTYGYTQTFISWWNISCIWHWEHRTLPPNFLTNFWYLSWPVVSGVLVSILGLLRGSCARLGMVLNHVLVIQEVQVFHLKGECRCVF